MKKQYDFRTDRFYNSNHLWIKENDSGQVTVGMDELGLDSLGEMAYLTLPDVGTVVAIGEAMGTMEAAKMTGELYAPVSGIVIRQNDTVLQNPLLVNEEPYDNGWLVKIDPTNWEDDSVGMVTGNDLSKWVDVEIERFQTQGILG